MSPAWETTDKWKRYLKSRERRAAYRTFFTSPGGREVLSDLSKFCCANRQTFDPSGSHITAFNEGARTVWLYIVSQIDADETKLQEIARKPDE